MYLNASRSSSWMSKPEKLFSHTQETFILSSRLFVYFCFHVVHKHTQTCSAFWTNFCRHLCHILAEWVDSQLHAGVALHCGIKNSNSGHTEEAILKNDWLCGGIHQVPELIVSGLMCNQGGSGPLQPAVQQHLCAPQLVQWCLCFLWAHWHFLTKLLRSAQFIVSVSPLLFWINHFRPGLVEVSSFLRSLSLFKDITLQADGTFHPKSTNFCFELRRLLCYATCIGEELSINLFVDIDFSNFTELLCIMTL